MMMPTDARQIKEMTDIREKQMEKALDLLDTARKQFAECLRQRNDARKDVEYMRADLRTMGEEYDALKKERDELLARLADVTENRDRWMAKCERMAEIARKAEVKG